MRASRSACRGRASLRRCIYKFALRTRCAARPTEMRTDILKWVDLPETLRARKVFASQDRPSLDKYLRATAVHTHILLPELCPTRAASALEHTLGAGAILTPHYFYLQIATISQLCIFVGLELESKIGQRARRAALLRKGGASWRACGSPAVCDQFSFRFPRQAWRNF